jgi:hypothetical protein
MPHTRTDGTKLGMRWVTYRNDHRDIYARIHVFFIKMQDRLITQDSLKKMRHAENLKGKIWFGTLREMRG